MVLVAGERLVHPQGLADVRVDVVVLVVVVAPEVVLHAVVAVDEEVVVGPEVLFLAHFMYLVSVIVS